MHNTNNNHTQSNTNTHAAHTLPDERVQQVVVGAEHDAGVLHQLAGCVVGAGADAFAHSHQVLHVPGLVQPVDPLQNCLVPHPVDAVVVAARLALRESDTNLCSG